MRFLIFAYPFLFALRVASMEIQKYRKLLFIYLLTRLITMRNPKEVDMTTCTRAWYNISILTD